ncbi:hypothetical protein [Cytobacillus firmus]|nr:hypothetical protein [Cytobacillus firmus]
MEQLWTQKGENQVAESESGATSDSESRKPGFCVGTQANFGLR